MKHSRMKPFALALTVGLSTSVAAATGSSAALGVDTPWSCTSGNPIANSADKTQGTASMQFLSAGYGLCTSPAMNCADFSHISDEILVDVKLPSVLPNPWWVGDLSLYVEAPSASVYNSWIGMAPLLGLPKDQWSTISIPATDTLLKVLRGTCSDAVVKFALNTSAVGVLVDNIRFAGDEPPVEMVLPLTEDGDDGQFDPSLSALPTGWSAQGERSNVLYVGAYNIDDWGGLGNGYTTGAFRFTLSNDIPAGAHITDARLSLYGRDVWEWDSSVDALQIAVELTDDADPISGLTDMPLSASGRPILANTVRWPEAGGLNWQYPGWNESTNVAPLLQELVDTVGGLQAGAHVQLYVFGVTSNINSEVTLEDSSHSDANHPTLTVVVN
ncbi:MAG: hypothetical protein ACM3ZE_05435 [Myxococcales bacterium]